MTEVASVASATSLYDCLLAQS